MTLPFEKPHPPSPFQDYIKIFHHSHQSPKPITTHLLTTNITDSSTLFHILQTLTLTSFLSSGFCNRVSTCSLISRFCFNVSFIARTALNVNTSKKEKNTMLCCLQEKKNVMLFMYLQSLCKRKLSQFINKITELVECCNRVMQKLTFLSVFCTNILDKDLIEYFNLSRKR